MIPHVTIATKMKPSGTPQRSCPSCDMSKSAPSAPAERRRCRHVPNAADFPAWNEHDLVFFVFVRELFGRELVGTGRVFIGCVFVVRVVCVFVGDVVVRFLGALVGFFLCGFFGIPFRGRVARDALRQNGLRRCAIFGSRWLVVVHEALGRRGFGLAHDH